VPHELPVDKGRRVGPMRHHRGVDRRDAVNRRAVAIHEKGGHPSSPEVGAVETHAPVWLAETNHLQPGRQRPVVVKPLAAGVRLKHRPRAGEGVRRFCANREAGLAGPPDVLVGAARERGEHGVLVVMELHKNIGRRVVEERKGVDALDAADGRDRVEQARVRVAESDEDVARVSCPAAQLLPCGLERRFATQDDGAPEGEADPASRHPDRENADVRGGARLPSIGQVGRRKTKGAVGLVPVGVLVDGCRRAQQPAVPVRNLIRRDRRPGVHLGCTPQGRRAARRPDATDGRGDNRFSALVARP